MRPPSNVERERLHELLADDVLWGVDRDERAELGRLLEAFPSEDAIGYELAAVAVVLASVEPEPLPAALRERIESQVHTVLPPAVSRDERHEAAPRSARDEARPTDRPGDRSPVLRKRGASGRVALVAGWGLAAAAGLLAVAGWWPRLGPGGGPREDGLSAGSAYERVAARPGSMRSEWTRAGSFQDLDVAGEIVWNSDEQEGWMRFEGLPANDPTVEQYQLWILVPDQEHPIDGGVFDATGEGELLVPVDAKLRVQADPAAFAVTIEKPGGVVVSTRERLVLLAPIEG